MHTTTATALFLSAVFSLVHAEELKAGDVPSACSAICGPIVTLTNTCDVNPDSETKRRRRGLRHRADDDGDTADDESDEAVEAQCVCSNTSFNVRSVAALCAACISQMGKATDDMDKIMSQCSFASTTFVPAATSAVAGVTVKATKPAFTAATATPGANTPTTGSGGSSSGGGSTPKASSGAGTSAAVVSCDPRAMMRVGLVAAAVGVFSLLLF